MIRDTTAQPHDPRNRNPFIHAAQEAARAGVLGSRTSNAIKWYKTFARAYKNPINATKFKSYLGESSGRSIVKIGHMYAYIYDAKHKDTLTVWDAFPLVFPFRDGGDRFWAINLHYAPMEARAVIMYNLYKLLSDTKMNDQTRLRLSWQRLQQLAASRFFEPLVHCYLKSHVRSQFIHVPVTEWQTALFLPTARFQKQTAAQVNRDYAKRVGGPR
jgi:hypothetical protein